MYVPYVYVRKVQHRPFESSGQWQYLNENDERNRTPVRNKTRDSYMLPYATLKHGCQGVCSGQYSGSFEFLLNNPLQQTKEVRALRRRSCLLAKHAEKKQKSICLIKQQRTRKQVSSRNPPSISYKHAEPKQRKSTPRTS